MIQNAFETISKYGITVQSQAKLGLYLNVIGGLLSVLGQDFILIVYYNNMVLVFVVKI